MLFSEAQHKKEKRVALVAVFATVGIPKDVEKLRAFFQSEARFKTMLHNLMGHHYADTFALCAKVHAEDDEDTSTLGFMRRIAQIDPDQAETREQEDPHDRSAPMFIHSVRDLLAKFDDLPTRLQYVTVNLMPKQEDLLALFGVAHVLKMVDLPEAEFQEALAQRDAQRGMAP